MSKKLIYGIQQVGVGVKNAPEVFKWYGQVLGADVCVFDDSNTAVDMAKYMGGKPRDKRAILAMNLQGGAGYEIWQYEEREPAAPEHPIQLGDYGISMINIKAKNVSATYKHLKGLGVNMLTEVVTGPDGVEAFYIQDPYDNIIQVKEYDSWFASTPKHVGGIFGAVIGVSNIDKALKLYSEVLGYNQVIYDESGVFEDYQGLPGGEHRIRRVLLGHRKERVGGFSRLLGTSQLELIQVEDRTAHKIFENRYWGDLGYIHLCFDVRHMDDLVKECGDHGFPFTVLSDPDFDMGDANGHWGYLEDPDGTLIEFVETHKVPIVKAINWSIKMKHRDPLKPLPNWLIKAMAIKRVKF